LNQKTYHLHPIAKVVVENMVRRFLKYIQPNELLTTYQVGKGIFAADGESHKRQKKNISPGFTSVKIREYTSTFYDCAHKVSLCQLPQCWIASSDASQ
jgi:hypothetical protein